MNYPMGGNSWHEVDIDPSSLSDHDSCIHRSPSGSYSDFGPSIYMLFLTVSTLHYKRERKRENAELSLRF